MGGENSRSGGRADIQVWEVKMCLRMDGVLALKHTTDPLDVIGRRLPFFPIYNIVCFCPTISLWSCDPFIASHMKTPARMVEDGAKPSEAVMSLVAERGERAEAYTSSSGGPVCARDPE